MIKVIALLLIASAVGAQTHTSLNVDGHWWLQLSANDKLHVANGIIIGFDTATHQAAAMNDLPLLMSLTQWRGGRTVREFLDVLYAQPPNRSLPIMYVLLSAYQIASEQGLLRRFPWLQLDVRQTLQDRQVQTPSQRDNRAY